MRGGEEQERRQCRASRRLRVSESFSGYRVTSPHDPGVARVSTFVHKALDIPI